MLATKRVPECDRILSLQRTGQPLVLEDLFGVPECDRIPSLQRTGQPLVLEDLFEVPESRHHIFFLQITDNYYCFIKQLLNNIIRFRKQAKPNLKFCPTVGDKIYIS